MPIDRMSWCDFVKEVVGLKRYAIISPATRNNPRNKRPAGVALTGDPDYRIVMEAYPFVTRKIISDDSPALQRALRDILYR